MKIIVIGANGQLSSDLVGVLSEETLIPLTHADIEITDFNQVMETIGSYQPDIVINTAAYHNVSECEENDLQAFKVNALGAKSLALACKKNNAALLHISTDYVFDGVKRQPYIEADLPNPLNAYGVSKLAGEHYIRYILDKHFIVRTSGLYGIHKCRAKGRNFIDLMLRLAKKRSEVRVIDDEVLTPTYTLDLSYQIKELIKTEHFGTYHITNNGQCSWYEFAKSIFELSNMKVNLERTTSTEFPSTVRRPTYSVLQNKHLEEIGLDQMRNWHDALKAFLEIREVD